MEMISLELYLYKRLNNLANIRMFKLVFAEKTQLVLGTNGCGKSSVAEESNPNPAERNEFFKGGHKVVVFKQNNETYTATSKFDIGQKHSLIRMSDGVELNEGGTITVQKELIYKLTGETRDIRQMLNGVIKFTAMPPPVRREWFTKLCVVDYTYAIRIYKRAGDKLRDATGYINKLKERLVGETARIVSPEQEAQIREKLATMTRESQELYMLRNAGAKTKSEVKTDQQSIQQHLADLTSRFKSVKKLLKDKYWIEIQAFEFDVAEAQQAVGRANARYESACAEYERLMKDGGIGEVISPEELVEMKRRVIDIDKAKNACLARKTLGLEFADPVAASDSLTSIFEDLRDLFLTIVENPDRVYNSDSHAQLIELHDKLIVSVKVSEEKLAVLGHKLMHLDSLAKKESIECPKCDHDWKLGYDKEVHEALVKSHETGSAYLATRKAELAEVVQKLADSTTYMEQMKQIIQVMRYSPSLQPLWDLFIEQDMTRKFPRQCSTYLEQVRGDLMHDLQATALNQELRTCIEAVNKAEATQTEGHAAKKLAIERAELNISWAVGEQKLANKSLHTTQTSLRDYNNVLDLEEKIKKCMLDVEQNVCDCVDTLKNEVIDTALSDAMGEIAILTSRINAIDAQNRTVKDITEQIELGEKDKAAYALIVKSLSPVDGIIAEGMLGFIREYISRMNAFIAKLWTYPLEVYDCSLEEDSAELNYKFPLSSNGADPVSDVSKASEGQAEVVDLAFRIAASQYLKLDDGPLILDEFGRTFDEAHRTAATTVIKQIMDQLNYSQFIIISHYHASHGSFHKAQMTVIDKRNITLPAGQVYNEHAVIEK